MIEVIPWNMIFNLQNVEETKILFLLYWYFFNNPDYPAHVFDEVNTRKLMDFMFEGVINDVFTTERFSDNVVLFSNCLNPLFVERYHKVLVKYDIK